MLFEKFSRWPPRCCPGTSCRAIVVRPKSEGQRNLSVSILNRLVRDRTYSFEEAREGLFSISSCSRSTGPTVRPDSY